MKQDVGFGWKKQSRDFKTYDKERQKYLRRIEQTNADLKERNSRLSLEIQRLKYQIDTLIDSYDNAGVMKDNSGNRAYVKELLDKIADKPTSTVAIEGLDSVLAREVLSLRKGHTTLQSKITELKKENRILKAKINTDYDQA